MLVNHPPVKPSIKPDPLRAIAMSLDKRLYLTSRENNGAFSVRHRHQHQLRYIPLKVLPLNYRSLSIEG